MTKIAGRQVEIGIGIETTAGTPVVAADYFKWDSFSMVSMSDKTLLQSARGIRNKTSNSLILKKYGKGSIEFSPTVDILPYVLGLVLGSRSSGAASGETTAAYDHTFTVQNANASMKTATMLVGQGSVQTERYANCVVDSFDLTVDKDLAKCKIGILSGFPDTSTISTSYTQDTLFSRNQMTATFGTSLATIAGTFATTTGTTTGVFSDGDTITIDKTTYTMRTALTNSGNTPYEVFIGAAVTNSLDNIRAAIDGLAGAGTLYGVGTLPHPTVKVTTKTASAITVVALQSGTAANTIATTKGVAANFSWAGVTMNSGTPGTGPNPTPLVAFSLNISNNVLFDDAFLSGANTPVAGGFIAGPLEIKGSYTLQFNDVVELAKYQANTFHSCVITMLGAFLGVVPTAEKIQFKLGDLVLTKAPVEYSIDGITLVKQEFTVQYDATDKEVTAIVTNAYVGTNYQ